MLILGHRGASKAAPENTATAFTKAFEMGADGIEFDVYQVDGASVVIHDRWLNRTTNGQGKVTEQSLSDLRALDAGNGQAIPLLSEVFSICPQRALINIEIKYAYDIELLAEEIQTCLRDSRLAMSQVVVSSFQHSWLKALKHIMPEMTIAALSASISLSTIDDALFLNADYANIDIDVVNEAFVKQAHQAGLQVFVYTVDHPQDILQMRAWGVDGIFTNVPDVARNCLNAT